MKKATQWPKDFKLDDIKKKYAVSHGVDPKKVAEFWDDFQDYCLANGSSYKDWDAAFRMRVRKAKEWNLFQGTYQKPVKQTRSKDRVSRAYTALVNGGEIDSVCKRLGLDEYDKECVVMAFNGGAQRAKQIASNMLREA